MKIIINDLADKAISDGAIRFRTSGEHDEQAVEDFVQHGKAIGGVFQIKIIRRNSPLDLLITWAEANAAYCISSLFVFTKFKFEILKMHFNEKVDNDLAPAPVEGKKHFSASIGLAPDARSSDLIHFSFLLPGQYKFDLAYKLRTDMLRLAHSLLTKFIVESHAEPPTPEA